MSEKMLRLLSLFQARTGMKEEGELGGRHQPATRKRDRGRRRAHRVRTAVVAASPRLVGGKKNRGSEQEIHRAR